MPSLPSLPSWNYKDKITSAKLQEMVDAVDFLMSPPMCKITSTVVQSLPDNTTTALIWDSVLEDTLGMWDSGHPTRITAAYPGLYAVLPVVEIAAAAAGSRRLTLRVNGSSLDGAMSQSTVGASPQGLGLGNTVRLAAGDYLEVLATLTGAGSSVNTGLTGFDPKVTVWWIHE
jgi:hypothetical protein